MMRRSTKQACGLSCWQPPFRTGIVELARDPQTESSLKAIIDPALLGRREAPHASWKELVDENPRGGTFDPASPQECEAATDRAGLDRDSPSSPPQATAGWSSASTDFKGRALAAR